MKTAAFRDIRSGSLFFHDRTLYYRCEKRAKGVDSFGSAKLDEYREFPEDTPVLDLGWSIHAALEQSRKFTTRPFIAVTKGADFWYDGRKYKKLNDTQGWHEPSGTVTEFGATVPTE